MTFREFEKWCNDRAWDGHWSRDNAIVCVQIIDKFNNIRWRREKAWKNSEEKLMAEEIVKSYE